MPITFSAVFARKFNSLDSEPLLVGTHGNHDPHPDHDKVAAFNTMIRGQTDEAKTLRSTYEEILIVHRGHQVARLLFPDLSKQAEEEARGRLGEAAFKADYHRRMVSALEAPGKHLRSARQERDAAERTLAEAQAHLDSIAPNEDQARVKERESAREATERYKAEQAARNESYYASTSQGVTEQTRKDAADRAAAEKDAQGRVAADLAIAQTVAADKIHAAKAAVEKAAADRAAAEQPATSPEPAPTQPTPTAEQPAPVEVATAA